MNREAQDVSPLEPEQCGLVSEPTWERVPLGGGFGLLCHPHGFVELTTAPCWAPALLGWDAGLDAWPLHVPAEPDVGGRRMPECEVLSGQRGPPSSVLCSV